MPKKGTQPKEQDSARHEYYNHIGWKASLDHALSSGWVQNSGVACLGAFILLVVAMVTSTGVKAAAIGFACFGTAFIWILAAAIVKHSAAAEDLKNNGLRFKVQISMVPRDAMSSLFWVRQRPATDTLSAIPISLYAVVTNIRDTPMTLDSIGVEVKENNGKWKKLRAVPTYGQDIYWVYGIPAGLKDAGLLDFTQLGLDQLLKGKQIAPNIPIRGWIFFRRPDDFNGTEGTTLQWKFTAEDSVGDRFESTTDPGMVQREVTEASDLQPNAPALNFGPSHLDISGEIKHIVMD